MKEAMYYERKKYDIVQCHLCPRHCVISEGNLGNCKVRKNVKGILYSFVYEKIASVGIDPIEKKPLYHFLPGSNVFSIGTYGCNMKCMHCQNFEIAQKNINENLTKELNSENAIKEAIDNECKSIAYTYNEPTVFFEYMIETAKLAKNAGLKNIIVSNGFINKKPLLELCEFIDAANIDLKFFDNIKYRKISDAMLDPILNTIKILVEKGIWVEITNLIIPGVNDGIDEIHKMCEWIKDNCGCDVPLHFSAFYPYYKMKDIPATQIDILKKAKKIAKSVGLNYVYIGNVKDVDNNTYCPICDTIVVARTEFYEIFTKSIKKNKCVNEHEIKGIWK